ncbi:hypothetical protein PR001_g10722 [Phytophthora rubi]|uniref:Uncharacterized protein n=1 Tax=Phytophthora rubi TaxID=129364 RepID=A0A6A3MSF4_9STRA|nr:hypothetical protein PR002_g10805 [Phytophthora rubi]KAE9032191.1 hypothetical protein PR001_g10722 [Phytophthora rubi]
MEDVTRDPAWIDDATILVTSNVDKAILTACAASHFAKRQNQLLFRWKRKLRLELPAGVDAIVYDEDANPELFAYFVAGAPANILDNNSGNVGWGVANGSPCRLHSLGWDDDTKRQAVLELVDGARSAGLHVVNLPFPPEYINVQLLDSNKDPLPASQWPPDVNLAVGDPTSNAGVVIPIGLMSANNRKR